MMWLWKCGLLLLQLTVGFGHMSDLSQTGSNTKNKTCPLMPGLSALAKEGITCMKTWEENDGLNIRLGEGSKCSQKNSVSTSFFKCIDGSWVRIQGNKRNSKRALANHFTSCPGDLHLNAPPRTRCAVAIWTPPTEEVSSHSGGNPGHCFTAGEHVITYDYEGALTWHWISGDTCSFKITVTVHECSTFNQLSNGYRNCDMGTLYGSVCTDTCNIGYKLTDEQPVTCVLQFGSPQWSKAFPTCNVRHCPLLPRFPFGQRSCSRGLDGDDSYSSICQHSCNPNYRLDGHVTIECLTTSTEAHWNYPFPTCEVAIPPNLSTCRVSIDGKNSTNSGNTTNCDSQKNETINMQPREVFFAIKSDLMFSNQNTIRNVNKYEVGVVRAAITVVQIHTSGTHSVLLNQTLNDLPMCQEKVTSTDVTNSLDCEGTIGLQNIILQNGESICAIMESFSGGYYQLEDDQGNLGSLIIFKELPKQRTVCFLYDSTKPAHCHETGCNKQPLLLSTRLTRTPEITLLIDGWIEPALPGGLETFEPHLDKYTLDLHEVNVGNGSLDVEKAAVNNSTLEWKANSTAQGGPYNLTVRLPEANPFLYAILLAVHDLAGNVRFARRLVFYDNSSTVEIVSNNPIIITTADTGSNYSWQTGSTSEICFSWKDRFINNEMLYNNFLLPIRADTQNNITGDYDQITGILPISGTDNVNGIIKFEVSWSRNGMNNSPPKEIIPVEAQTACIQEVLVDGENYDIMITATDIMGNSKTDRVSVGIDHSSPELSIVGLRGRLEREGMFVHNNTDLSKMVLMVEARDPHSGISTLLWTLQTGDSSVVVGSGSVGVHRLQNATNCTGEIFCYCPIIGTCEIYRYLFTFNNLVATNSHEGLHHRDYVIKVSATNNAGLPSTKVQTILVDATPPSAGVVLDGLRVASEAEKDFTSFGVAHIHWNGFLDHESNIISYGVVLASHCMTGEEFHSLENIVTVDSDTITAINFPMEGFYIANVIAYNGAMEPSTVACSDGITYDTSPPSIVNVSIVHARTGRSIGCTKEAVWLVNRDLTRSRLNQTKVCSDVCASSLSFVSIEHFPITGNSFLDEDVSDDLCTRLPLMSLDSPILLPSDYLRLTWAARDNESDVDEFYVGIGQDRTSEAAPDLSPFSPTHGHALYHVRHSGLGHGAVFFIFLQVLSKAGLYANITLGPIIIDVTPPLVTENLAALVDGEFLVVQWGDKSFRDLEQPVGVDFVITYRVGHEEAFVTPFLSLPESTAVKCQQQNVTGCVRYPISVLQTHDTESGRSFLFQLHVMNAAGHVATVNTSSVRLPARVPPSHAVVIEITAPASSLPDVSQESMRTSAQPPTPPNSVTNAQSFVYQKSSTTSQSSPPMPLTAAATTPKATHTTTANLTAVHASFSAEQTRLSNVQHFHETSTRYSRSRDVLTDVDVIVQTNDVCVAWNGFYREDGISTQVGIGSNPSQANVVSFHSAAENPTCLNTSSLPTYTQLFSLVMATNSAGTSILSSDGFYLVPRKDASNKIMVFNGKGCGQDVIGSQVVEPAFTPTEINLTITIPTHSGDIYFVQFNPFISNVTFKGANIMYTTLYGYQVLTTSSIITAALPITAKHNITVEIKSCLKNAVILHHSVDHMSVTWELSGPWTEFILYLKARLIDNTCMQMSIKKDKYVMERCMVAQRYTSPNAERLDFQGVTVTSGHTYITTISACFHEECLLTTQSDPVLYDVTQRLLFIDNAIVINQTLQDIEVEVNASIQPPFTSDFFQGRSLTFRWTISKDEFASLALNEWQLQDIGMSDSLAFTVSTPISIGTGSGSLYACVQPLYPWKQNNPTCRKIVRPTTLNHVNPVHLIELSQSDFRERNFDEYLHSQQLGSKLHELYDLDLDFAKEGDSLCAVVTDGDGRNISWFLMTKSRVPSERDCTADSSCLSTKTTNNGRVVLSEYDAKLQDGHMYFVCAVVSYRHTDWRGQSSNSQSEYEICGDGVFIDSTPPGRGDVTIVNSESGYLPTNDRVLVSWQGFFDAGTEASQENTFLSLNYSVALGSYPDAEDIAHFIHIGQRNSWTFEHLNITSGSLCIATVKAEDRVGHITQGWSDQVIVDFTPPTGGRVAAGKTTQEMFVSVPVPVHWETIEDSESGVKSVEVAISTFGVTDDIEPFTTVTGQSALLSGSSNLLDGHTYVVLLKATNNAGLSMLTSSDPFIVDTSPPEIGIVWNSDSNSSKHSAYSTEVGTYRAYWSEFLDPHSGLAYFKVGLGSRHGETDVRPFIYVGLQTSYIWKHELQQGKKYYTTVQACNRANLCSVTSSTSLIFDNSPPTSGVVTVGFDGHHNKFLGHSSSLSVQWTGFSDPQTGIEEFQWCVGTEPGNCSISHYQPTLLSRSTIRANVTLPLDTLLYVTVCARNPVGLQTVGVSDSFKVDPSPPIVVDETHFLSPRDRTAVSGQWDRSLLHVGWKFHDPDSPVVSHTINIRSQMSGRLIIEPIKIAAENEIQILLDGKHLLSDGDLYWVAVTACNAASLCTTSTSAALLVDSTPPLVGTFESTLFWQRSPIATNGNITTVVSVSWSKFSDPESGLVEYFITAGRKYNGEELSGGQVRVPHSNASHKQNLTLTMSEQLRAGDVIYFSIWAENSLGLNSTMARMAFDVVQDNVNGASGSLISVRHSCDVAYCTKECTCGETDKCNINTNDCRVLERTDKRLAGLEVYPHIGTVTKQQQFTTSQKCLEGHWQLSDVTYITNISRFEWTFGQIGNTSGQGIFDAKTGIWHDVGRSTHAVYCMPGERMLVDNFGYVLQVRAWLSSEDHVNFTSDPVTVDRTPPTVRRGKAILDSDENCAIDFDYINRTSTVTSCWSGVFVDAESNVTQYELWVGMSPYADDYIKKSNVGMNTSFIVSTTGFEEGTRYYVTVRAWNGAGLLTTAVSDGIAVDLTPPRAGVVFPAKHNSARQAQSSVTSLTASWHGFEDRHSGVVAYYLSVYDADDDSAPLVPFHDVGVETELVLEGLTLTHLHSYKIIVKARDMAGWESSAVESPPLLVDTTPPEGITCKAFRLQESKEMISVSSNSFLWNSYGTTFDVMFAELNELLKIVVEGDNIHPGCTGYVRVDELKMPLYIRYGNFENATSEHLLLMPSEGNTTLDIAVGCNSGAKLVAKLHRCLQAGPSPDKAVTIHQLSQQSISICARIRDSESGIKSMLVGVGTTEGGLQAQPFTPIGHSGHTVYDVHVQHGSPLYATILAENHAGLWARFVSQPVYMDRTAPTISDVNLEVKYKGEGDLNKTEVWVEAKWNSTDIESNVETCICKLEYQQSVSNGLQHSGDVSPGRCQWQLKRPQHGTSLLVTVSCVNGVQLHASRSSSPATILLRPPDVSAASVVILSNNAFMSPYDWFDPRIRSANSTLEICWHGIDDATVSQFQYRFLHESRPLTDWSLSNLYKTSAVLEIGSQAFPEGNLTAEVQALNSRMMTSDKAVTTVQLDDSKPLLTGKAVTSTLSDEHLRLDWRDVFSVNRDVTYSVFAGTASSLGDVINHVVTKTTWLEATWTKPLSELYVIIKAVYPNGLSETYTSKLPM